MERKKTAPTDILKLRPLRLLRPLRSRGRVLSVAVTACLSPRRGSPRPLNYSSLLSTTLKLLSTTLNFFPYKTVRDHHNGLNGHNGL